MGSFSLWHWGIVLLIIAFPALIIATERSGKRVGRAKYIGVLVAAVVVLSLPDILFVIAQLPQPEWTTGVAFLANIAITVWLYRTIVQRLRDAGHSKMLGYVACIPLVNLLFLLYLMFPASRADVPAIRAFE